ncbi:DUF1904 family protein [Fusobacterium sp. MFO224]|uniref:DUF1904 family protein n=1 Tax=Fusobacterium sp. MFO224 TaxID=3378070 RepID=UPI0038518B19
MPYIKVSGLSKDKLCETSNDLVEIVSKITGTPKENIRIFYNPMLEILNGKICENRLNIDIDWMPRSQEMCDAVSKEFKEYFKNYNFELIKIYFLELVREKYYI